MGLAADVAKRRRLCVVHVVPHGLECLEVGKCGGQILVRHPAMNVPGHDLVEPARLHESGAHDLCKERLLPKLGEFRKKAALDIGTADIFTHLVELHQKRRRFLKEIARKDN